MKTTENQGAELVRNYVTTTWTPQRAQVVQNGLKLRVRRRRQQKVALLSVAMTLLVAGGGTWLLHDNSGSKPMPYATIPTPAVVPSSLRLGSSNDGIQIATLAAEDDIADVVSQIKGDEWRLIGSGARFVVSVRGTRHFLVHANSVTIDVLGAAFLVTRNDGNVQVSVQRDNVHVAWAGGAKVVSAGEAFTFPLETRDNAKLAKPPRTAQRAQAWQGLANRGQFDEAYSALEAAIAVDGSHAVPDEPGSLLLAADAARLSRHPEQSLAHLQRFVRRFPKDPRASLAAFTLGLVLLEELGRPRDAATAFAQSRSIAPRGDLAEDALAREAEAFFRAGDAMMAKRAAENYLRSFPNGRRMPAVKRYGAIE